MSRVDNVLMFGFQSYKELFTNEVLDPYLQDLSIKTDDERKAEVFYYSLALV